ncbi:MAG: homocysteine S-methyltransferase family protein, partial [Acidimicrobiia bacterium]|nr:homocysteine S-methyltransferase family protein [Acidimicrobiia bacterium]
VPEHTDGWYGGAALSHPDILRDVHEEYIRLGANLIISNTFATHKGVLRDAGVEDDFEALNRRSVELAVEARDSGDRPEVVVAAGISHWSFTGEDPSLDDLERDATEQVAIMAAAGAELIILEMMISVDRMHRLIKAAKTTGLPIWVGFAVGGEEGEIPDRNVMTLRSGDLLADAIDSLDGLGIDLISIMHTDVDLVDPCLDVMFERWPGPIGVYAHSWRGIDPVDYATFSQGWLERGVNLIGGCCGTVPDHIVELAKIDSLGA